MYYKIPQYQIPNALPRNLGFGSAMWRTWEMGLRQVFLQKFLAYLMIFHSGWSEPKVVLQNIEKSSNVSQICAKNQGIGDGYTHTLDTQAIKLHYWPGEKQNEEKISQKKLIFDPSFFAKIMALYSLVYRVRQSLHVATTLQKMMKSLAQLS